MKLIFAVVDSEDERDVSEAMLKAGLFMTKIASTGGLLSGKRTTIMCAVRAERVADALDAIRCGTRRRVCETDGGLPFKPEELPELGSSVTVGGATVFVLPVESCYKF